MDFESESATRKRAVGAEKCAAQVAKAQTLALAEYRGLTVEHLNVLRRTARETGACTLHVLKNTLARSRRRRHAVRGGCR